MAVESTKLPEDAAQRLLAAEALSREATKQLVAESRWQITLCDCVEALDVALALADAHDHDVRFVTPNGIGKYTVISRKRDADRPAEV